MGNVQTAASAEELLWRQTPGGELVDLGRPHRVPLGQLRLQRAPKGILSRRETILLGVLALREKANVEKGLGIVLVVTGIVTLNIAAGG